MDDEQELYKLWRIRKTIMQDGSGRRRILHRNLLFQCEYLPSERVDRIPPANRDRNNQPGRVSQRRELANTRPREITVSGRQEQSDSSSSSGPDEYVFNRAVPTRNTRAVSKKSREIEADNSPPIGSDKDTDQREEGTETEEGTAADDEDSEAEMLNHSTSSSGRSSNSSRRPQRRRKPTQLLTYDQLGQPTYQSMVQKVSGFLGSPPWAYPTEPYTGGTSKSTSLSVHGRIPCY
ncbi:C-mannosyltransferase dpy-19 homolog [Argopecten irradians]|uniref:C-mannosyltransferase dpy-19 homolog n=1 Tax=Argopecten irradians TaxID=31199 RepID=UPI0037105A28